MPKNVTYTHSRQCQKHIRRALITDESMWESFCLSVYRIPSVLIYVCKELFRFLEVFGLLQRYMGLELNQYSLKPCCCASLRKYVMNLIGSCNTFLFIVRRKTQYRDWISFQWRFMKQKLKITKQFHFSTPNFFVALTNC